MASSSGAARLRPAAASLLRAALRCSTRRRRTLSARDKAARIEGEVAVGTHSSGHVQQATVCATRSGQQWSAERERGRQRFGRHVVQHWAGHHSGTKTPWALGALGLWGGRDSWSPPRSLTHFAPHNSSVNKGNGGRGGGQDKGRRKAGVAVKSERNTCTNSRSSGLVWVWLLCAALRCSGTKYGRALAVASGSLGGWSYFGAQQTCGPDYSP